MKKTILTVALSFLFAATYANCNTVVANSDFSTSSFVEENALNSFCKSIMKGDVEMVKQLLKLGEDVNAKSLGRTPAMYAARYNRAEILQLLIDNGADLSIKSTKERLTARDFAEKSKAKDALAVLDAAEMK